ncbi:MAG: hypothetical protein ACKO5X_00540 [Limnohabitans sp.]
MTSLQDHPKIEMLPDIVEGIHVKDALRKLFQDGKNGTPDNISKAGCLALANLSNQLGAAQGKGHVVWNAWRREFPVENPKIIDLARNCVTFSEEVFTEWKNFSFFEFGDMANFENTQFEKGACFNYAKFGDQSNFNDSSASHIKFEWTQWGSVSRFCRSSYRSHVSFMGAQFKSAFFEKYDFGGSAFFFGAAWSSAKSSVSLNWKWKRKLCAKLV